MRRSRTDVGYAVAQPDSREIRRRLDAPTTSGDWFACGRVIACQHRSADSVWVASRVRSRGAHMDTHACGSFVYVTLKKRVQAGHGSPSSQARTKHQARVKGRCSSHSKRRGLLLILKPAKQLSSQASPPAPLVSLSLTMAPNTQLATTAREECASLPTTHMRIAFFSAHSYDIASMAAMAEKEGVAPKHELFFLPHRLSEQTATLAANCEAVVIFVNDTADAGVLKQLYAGGTRVLFLRCAGFDMVDLDVAKELDIPVVRVPAYSPYAVAEHAAALMMTLNRNIHRAYNRTRELNFRLAGLLGFDVNGKTVGVVGTGKIGALFARICKGFGCTVLVYDVAQNPEAISYGVEYVTLDEIWARADIISLHCPLFPSTRHIVNEESIQKMKPGVMIINTSRGGLIDTSALVKGLKHNKIGGVGLDVFEGEGDFFYSDHSGELIPDDTLARLFTFSNVIITGHQAFFTKEALENIAKTTMDNIKAYTANAELRNRV